MELVEYQSKIESRLFEVKNLIDNGTDDQEIATLLNISLTDLYQLKENYPDFQRLFELYKPVENAKLEQAFIKRALGFEYTEEKIIGRRTADGNFLPDRVEKTKKYFPPDSQCLIFAMKTRLGYIEEQKLSLSGSVNNNVKMEVVLSIPNNGRMKEIKEE